MVLIDILTYPVKSLAGGRHDTAQVHLWGLAQDRRWMVVDTAGRFLTQREHPRMAVLHATTTGETLTLHAPDKQALTVPPGPHGQACRVIVWRDSVKAIDCGEDAAVWLTEALGVTCRLVYLADTQARPLRPDYAHAAEEVVTFVDGFPVLMTSQASLADLNDRLGTPVPMSRFRPNLVIEGALAWEEDNWQRVRIGGTVFRIGKPCERCIMTTIDQQTGERPDGNEPLATLGRFRRDRAGKILFGQNLVPEITGDIRVGDKVTPEA